MARSQRNSLLETRTSRLKLKVGARYYLQIGEGIALGYRRTADGFGNWQARIYMPDGRYDFRAIATADDFVESNGADVLTFFQAQEKVREVHAEVIAGKTLKPITVKEVADRYMDWFRDNRKAVQETANTIKAHIGPAFGDIVVSELTTQSIKAWHAKLAASPVRRRTGLGRKPNFGEKAATPEQKRARKSTANRILTVLKAMLNKAFQDELVNDDLAWRRVKPFERADEPVTRFLTVDEATRLINVCRADLRELIKAALFTGARFSELTGLHVLDVNVGTASIYIKPAKSGKGRYVPLSADGLNFFQEAILGKTKNALAFTKQDGAMWGKNQHSRALKEACAIAKLPPDFGFHELRHTYASLLAQSGVDLLTISKLLGHSDTRITSRHYAHLCDRTLANAVQAHVPSFGHIANSKISSIR